MMYLRVLKVLTPFIWVFSRYVVSPPDWIDEAATIEYGMSAGSFLIDIFILQNLLEHDIMWTWFLVAGMRDLATME